MFYIVFISLQAYSMILFMTIPPPVASPPRGRSPRLAEAVDGARGVLGVAAAVHLSTTAVQPSRIAGLQMYKTVVFCYVT